MGRMAVAWVGLLGLLVTGCVAVPVHPPAGMVPEGEPTAVLLAPLASSSQGHAPPPGSQLDGAHPVEFYIGQALARNPEVRAAERRVAALDAVIPQVTALPDPMVNQTIWPITANSPQTASGRMPYSLMVSQQFPWFGKLHLRGRIAEAEARIALTEAAEVQLKVIEGVKTAYYEISFNDRAIRITEENEKFLRDYIRAAEARYTVGQASQQDVLRAEVELRKLEDQLVQYRQQREVAQADLAKLLSLPPEADLRAADSPEPPAVPEQLESLYQIALASRPELQGRLQAVFRDQQRVELAKREYRPDVTLGLSYDAMTTRDALSAVADGSDNLGITVGFNLPVRFQKYAAGVNEAENRVAESARMYEAARDDTFRSIRRLTAQARALEKEIELYRRKGTGILSSAEQTLNVSFADYRTGKVDSLTVLSNYTQLLFFRVQVVRLEASLGQVLASLERAVGRHLADPSAGAGQHVSPNPEVLPPPEQALAGH